ncbi:MAG: hypothetical protein QW520_01220 [Methanomassiliicoccales archaeon]
MVEKFLGDDHLEAALLRNIENEEVFLLEIDGVFLEIGMEPKVGPLRNHVRLNEIGEVPVGKDMSTEVEGLFRCRGCD